MKRLKNILCLIVIFTLTVSAFSADAGASWYNDVVGGTYSSIIGIPYVADTFHGVEARYSLTPGSYQCTELITRFYKEAYGLDVFIFADYGYLVPGGAEPIEMLTSGYKFVTGESPQPGDVIYSPSSKRDGRGDHWAIVKSFNGASITLFEQNVKDGSKAGSGRRVKYPSENYILYSPKFAADNSRPVLRDVVSATTTTTKKAVTTKAATTVAATTAKATTTAAAKTQPVSSTETTATTAVTTSVPETTTGIFYMEDGMYEVVVPANEIVFSETDESATASEETTTFAEATFPSAAQASSSSQTTDDTHNKDIMLILVIGISGAFLTAFVLFLIFGKKRRG